MYEININDKYSKYEYTTKNASGQIITLDFLVTGTHKHIFYFVTFYIGKRKQGYQYLKTTGKDGIKSLVWAKNCIKHFIDYIKNQESFSNTSKITKHTIIIRWDDNRRRDVYYNGLKSLKFYYGMYEGFKALIYDIK